MLHKMWHQCKIYGSLYSRTDDIFCLIKFLVFWWTVSFFRSCEFIWWDFKYKNSLPIPLPLFSVLNQFKGSLSVWNFVTRSTFPKRDLIKLFLNKDLLFWESATCEVVNPFWISFFLKGELPLTYLTWLFLTYTNSFVILKFCSVIERI